MSANNGNGEDKKLGLPVDRVIEVAAQIEPVKTPYTNSVLKGPPNSDIGDLNCELALDDDDRVVTVSAWQPNEEQARMLAAGAHLRMGVWQHPIPPLSLAIEAPFCEVDEAEMAFDTERGVFRCPQCSLVRTWRAEPTDGFTQARSDFRPVEEDPEA